MKIDDIEKTIVDVAAAKTDLLGIILTGGQSSRMGSDKSRLWYHGKAQCIHLFELLSGLTVETFLSCNEEQAQHPGSIPLIQDVFPQSGPMGGILSAFRRFPDKGLLTVPCDLPFLDRRTISTLIQNRNPDKIATTFRNPETGSLEPLVTIWEPRAQPVLSRYFSNGNLSPYRLLTTESVETITADAPRVFRNVNTNQEYLGILQTLQG